MTKEVKTDRTGGNMSTAHSFLHLLVHWHVSVKNIGRCGPFSEPLSYLLFQSPVFWRSAGDLSMKTTYRKKKWRDSKRSWDFVQIPGWNRVWPKDLEEMVPPLPGEQLLIQTSATSAQWSAQSWARDLGYICWVSRRQPASVLSLVCWAFRCKFFSSTLVVWEDVGLVPSLLKNGLTQADGTEAWRHASGTQVFLRHHPYPPCLKPHLPWTFL